MSVTWTSSDYRESTKWTTTTTISKPETELTEVQTTPEQIETTTGATGQGLNKVLVIVLSLIGSIILIILLVTIIVICLRRNAQAMRNTPVLQHPQEMDGRAREVDEDAEDNVCTEDTHDSAHAKDKASRENTEVADKSKAHPPPPPPPPPTTTTTTKSPQSQLKRNVYEEETSPTGDAFLNIGQSIQGIHQISLTTGGTGPVGHTPDGTNGTNLDASPTCYAGEGNIYENVGQLRQKSDSGQRTADDKQGKVPTYVNFATAGDLSQPYYGLTERSEEIYDNNEAARTAAIGEEIYDNNEAAKTAAIGEEIYVNYVSDALAGHGTPVVDNSDTIDDRLSNQRQRSRKRQTMLPPD